MTTPPTNPDELPTGPLRKSRTLWWVFLAILALAVLGYYFFAQRAIGRDVEPSDPQSGRGIPPVEAPEPSR